MIKTPTKRKRRTKAKAAAPKSRKSIKTKARKPARAQRARGKATAVAPAGLRALLSEKSNGKSLPLRASYDIAKTTDTNKRHWVNADALSSRAANTLQVRATIRNRARYEVENNSYGKGIVETLANDLIGRGPRIQVDELVDEAVQNEIETVVRKHFRVIKLAKKLRTLRKAKVVDGESFGIHATNLGLKSRVKLDLQVIECDRVTDPIQDQTIANRVDGLIHDDFGNVVGYRVLDEHPGGLSFSTTADTIGADDMAHWFRQDRPEQERGISELKPALPLFADLRRYTLAVIAAAETAADFPMVITSSAPPDPTAVDDIEPMDTVELERNIATTLPKGWDLKGLKAEQPTQQYKAFKNELLNEIARCVNMPFNIAAGNSSDYNFASGRLDHQGYFKTLEVDRGECELDVLDPFTTAFLAEAVLVPGMLSPAARAEIRRGLEWTWHWDGREHVDPMKEANAATIKLKNGLTNYRREFGKEGLDWRKELRQSSREQKFIFENDIKVELIEIEDKSNPDE